MIHSRFYKTPQSNLEMENNRHSLHKILEQEIQTVIFFQAQSEIAVL